MGKASAATVEELAEEIERIKTMLVIQQAEIMSLKAGSGGGKPSGQTEEAIKKRCNQIPKDLLKCIDCGHRFTLESEDWKACIKAIP